MGKLPKVGDTVEVRWIDSGAMHHCVGKGTDEVKLGIQRVIGEVVGYGTTLEDGDTLILAHAITQPDYDPDSDTASLLWVPSILDWTKLRIGERS